VLDRLIVNPKVGGYIMRTLVVLMLVSMMMVAAVPAYAAEATHMWKCELDDDATEKEVMAMAGEWLKAARTMKGGERLEARVLFPVAVNAIGEFDLFFVVVAPTFEEWGRFWDNYEGSPAAEVDKRNQEMVVCPDSVVWESVKVK
jgi:hypothetical protein